MTEEINEQLSELKREYHGNFEYCARISTKVYVQRVVGTEEVVFSNCYHLEIHGGNVHKCVRYQQTNGLIACLLDNSCLTQEPV